MFLGIVFKFSSYCSCMLYLTSNVLFLIFNMLHYHLKSLQHAVSCVWNTFPPLLQLANFTHSSRPHSNTTCFVQSSLAQCVHPIGVAQVLLLCSSQHLVGSIITPGHSVLPLLYTDLSPSIA